MSLNVDQNRYIVTIDGVDYTRYVPMPIKWASLLDERLDEGRMSLKNVPVDLFLPLSKVNIHLVDLEYKITDLTFLVAADEATEVPVGSGRYNHELSLIEETKELEGVLCESLTFTNALGRSYTGAPKAAPVVYE